MGAVTVREEVGQLAIDSKMLLGSAIGQDRRPGWERMKRIGRAVYSGEDSLLAPNCHSSLVIGV